VTTKIDFKKRLKHLYAPRHAITEIVQVPPMSFLMIDGEGDPNTSAAYSDAVVGLYSVSYALKFMSKRLFDQDYVVMPLEGLWTAANLQSFIDRKKDEWAWTMMIMQPDWITHEAVIETIDSTIQKKGFPALPRLRFDVFEEGQSVQTLHIGSYDEEGPAIAEMHEVFMPAHRLRPTGNHHEIYLSDPRKTEASKLKTILRQPVEIVAIDPTTPAAVSALRTATRIPERAETIREAISPRNFR
jgi:hypothetical protein